MLMEKVEPKMIAKKNEMRLEWNRLEGTKTSCIRFEPLVFMVMCVILLYVFMICSLSLLLVAALIELRFIIARFKGYIPDNT